MTNVLFVKPSDLKRYSIINGVTDSDTFIQYIALSQDRHIQNVLGTKLYEKLSTLISQSTLNDPGNSQYKSLLEDYVVPMTIFYTLVDFLPFAQYQLTNRGIFKATTEDSLTADKEEVDNLVERYRDMAESYKERFISHMAYNSGQYPEYLNNSNDDVQPDTNNFFGGLELEY